MSEADDIEAMLKEAIEQHDGGGIKTCDKCDGTGDFYFTEPYTCPRCDGEGWVYCDDKLRAVASVLAGHFAALRADIAALRATQKEKP